MVTKRKLLEYKVTNKPITCTTPFVVIFKIFRPRFDPSVLFQPAFYTGKSEIR